MAKVNLLPGWLKRQRVIDWRTIVAVVVLVSATASAGFYYYLMFQRIQLTRHDLERVHEEQALLRPVLERGAQLEVEQRAIRDKKAFLEGIRARRWAPVLSEVARLAPVNVQLLLVELSDPANLALKGRAGNLEAIAQLMVGIDRSNLLQRSDVKYAKDDEGRYSFEVHCRIR